MIVFGLKGGIFPLYFWMPGSYYAPPAAVSALFGALLTKVGLYAITRVFTLISPKTPLYSSINGLACGAYDHLRGHRLDRLLGCSKIIIYNIVTAVGVILFGIAANTPASIEGSVYYLIHDMIIKGALLCLAERFCPDRDKQPEKMSGLIKTIPCSAGCL
ncbi:proton-conducting transporter membrane subunit [Bacillus licheniformis]|nr:proton-conducting transporter membrane subunit [Bacillus licheniformis]